MLAARIKEICRQFVGTFNLVVINGQVYDLNTNTRCSDDWCRVKLLNFFDDVDSRCIDAILETLKLLECENAADHSIASANGLKLISPSDYHQPTIERLQATFGDGLIPLIEWVHRLNEGDTPKQALNVYGVSNCGKSYFIDNTIAKMFNCTIGDWQGDWTIQSATDETQLIMFNDRDKGCIPANKWEFLKRAQQGRRVFIEVNPKCGAKYLIFAALTSLIQTQLPARLWKPEVSYDANLRLEWEAEEQAFKNRMLFVEFKIDNHDFDWHWDTIYSVFTRGSLTYNISRDMEVQNG